MSILEIPNLGKGENQPKGQKRKNNHHSPKFHNRIGVINSQKPGFVEMT